VIEQRRILKKADNEDAEFEQGDSEEISKFKLCRKW